MNTYAFISVRRGEVPELSAIVGAESAEEAIRKAEYYPFGLTSYYDRIGLDPSYTMQDFEDMVFAYYDLYDEDDTAAYNGMDGTHHIMVTIPGYKEDGINGHFISITPG